MSNSDNKTWRDYCVRGFGWWLVMFLISIVQLWIVLYACCICENDSVKEKANDLVRDWILVFASGIIAVSVAVEYLFRKFTYNSKEIFFIFITPFILFGIIGIRYLLVVLHVVSNSSLSQEIFNYLMVLATSVYSVFSKAYFFLKDDNKDDEKPK